MTPSAALGDDDRARLREVAERILGSLREADEAVDEALMRLSSSDASAADESTERLATIVARVCYDRLRAKRSAVALAGTDDCDPNALLADSLGLALLTVLESLTPAERLAFVLHELVALPLEETAALIDRSTVATEELVSAVRSRLRGSVRSPRQHVSQAGARSGHPCVATTQREKRQ